MDDMIKRSDAINLCGKWRNRTNEHHDKNGWYIADTLLKAIKELPSADGPQGEWVYGEHNVAMCDGYRCNRCDFFVPWDYEHKFIDFINDYHYCPSCGARMKGADDGNK